MVFSRIVLTTLTRAVPANIQPDVMEKTLILTEKPSVANDIAAAMGGFEKKEDYFESDNAFITWAVGHLVTLAEPEDYDKGFKYWTLQSLPIIPKQFDLKPIAKTESRLKRINYLAKRSGGIINACDAGREGELIFRYIYEYLNLDNPFKRLWLQSMTKGSIVEGFKKLRPGEELNNLGESAKCRSEADWLVGINATRAFTRRLGNLLSIGRVQTPTLSIIVEREKIISSFVPETFYEIEALFKAKSGEYKGKWFIELPKNPNKSAVLDSAMIKDLKSQYGDVIDSALKFNSDAKAGDRLDSVASRKAAEQIIKAVDGNTGKIVTEDHKQQNQSPYLLFDLNDLQREANKRYSFPAAKTLRIAQDLYEDKKLLTYPRTDSRYLPEDYIETCGTIFKSLGTSSEYKEIVTPLYDKKIEKKKRIFDNSKISDHFAIIPTDKSPKGVELTPDQHKIYDLVVKRFVSAFYPDAVWEVVKRVTQVDKFTFKSDAKALKEPGFLAVYGKEEQDEAPLPPVKLGEEVATKDTEVFEKQTTPPPRYNEGTLLSAMEGAGRAIEDEELKDAMKDKGLGTPATRASIIERLLEVGYLERAGKELVPTTKGIALYDLLMSFPLPELCSPEMTGEWEYKLACIEKGELKAEKFIDSIEDFTKDLVERVKTRSFDSPLSTEDSEAKVIGVCPLCGADVIEGFMSFRCSNFKPKKKAGKGKKKAEVEEEQDSGDGCMFTIWKTISGKIITEEIAKELIGNKQSGPHGGFRSKGGRPFSAKLLLGDDGKIAFEFEKSAQSSQTDNKAEDEGPGEIIGKCPICSGNVLETGSAFRCENYKKSCNLSLSKVILGKTITTEQALNLLNEKRTDKLSGFISKKGRFFSAYLVVKDDGKVGFEFDNTRATKSDTEAKPAKKPAAKTASAKKTAAKPKAVASKPKQTKKSE